MNLENKSIALLATDGFEDSELTKPMEAVQGAGAKVIVISDKSDKIVGKNDTEIDVDQTIQNVKAEDFDGLLLPGGVMNPDVMRQKAGPGRECTPF